MISQLRPAIVSFVAFTLITGVAYPLLVTGVAKVAFAKQAEGSFLPGGASTLIGQPFDDPKYFWSRLSATSPGPYNAAASSGSNLGPTNPALTDAAKGRIDALRSADPGNAQPAPVDLVTASASGLDPHITPAAAEFQVGRVARTRGIEVSRVRELIAQHTEGRQFGVLGERRVNVLELNLALDAFQRSSKEATLISGGYH
jgi:K+-transporting ATPase ATPase C chain